MTRESRIESELRDLIRASGGECYKFTSPGRRGVPDRIVVLPAEDGVAARVIFVETKATGGKLQPHQVREHVRLQKLGARVVTLASLDAVRRFVEFL